MNILGLTAYAHNAAAVVYDGSETFGAEQERFDGIRKSGAFPEAVIRDLVLPAVGTARDIDLIAFPWEPRNFVLTYAKVFCNDLPWSLNLIHPGASPNLNIYSGVKVATHLRRDLRRALEGRLPPIRFVEHHLAHAANAFFSSSFDRALVLVADAFGDLASLSLFLGEGAQLRKLYQNNFLDSLGVLYACVTQHLGFRTLYDEGKVMALAGSGDDSLVPAFSRIVQLLPDGRYHFDFSYLNFHRSGERAPFTRRFDEIFGPRRTPGTLPTQADRNLARALQRTLEDTLIHVVRGASAHYGIDQLCFSGGIALNCLANGRLLEETGVRAIFVPPAPDDSGAVLGAAQAVAHLALGRARPSVTPVAIGPEYSAARIRTVLNGRYTVTQPPDLAAIVADLVAAGQVVGWFQGRMEFGPRALGARSILADPRRADMRDRLNRMKRREPFRPFGPAVLAEHAGTVFHRVPVSPYMSFAVPVRREFQSRIAAALHVDGTARLQTLARGDGGSLRPVVEAFHARTGVPCVINTSLNCQSPIAATPEDALACFERAELDALAIGPYLVSRPPRAE